MDKVSVLLASSYKGLRQSLRTLLENEGWINVVGTSDSMTEAVELAEKYLPQVIVLDYELAGSNTRIGQKLLDIDPDIKIIVLSVFDYVGQIGTEDTPGAANDLASVEWVSKNSNPADLLKLISGNRQRRIH